MKKHPVLIETAIARAIAKLGTTARDCTGRLNNRHLPFGMALMAASLGAMAQGQGDGEKTLATVNVVGAVEVESGKDSLRVSETGIGKGRQQLRDIPQSVTVVTEKLIDDRNLDTVKEALKNTAGITFLAAEGGEEDIRLRGFALGATGDIFIDGMRDPAIYDRDTFNLDRMEVLRGSASMLFGRGSTGGAVNQVTKKPSLMSENQLDITLGSHDYVRLVGDLNIATGNKSALRVNAMHTKADNNGSGSALDKYGLAAAYSWGIGDDNEFQVSLFHLDNKNGINYGIPFIAPYPGAPATDRRLLPLDPDAYYGAASDYNHSSGSIATFSHLHRFDWDGELKTQFRVGEFERDQRSGAIRLAAAALQPGGVAATLQTFGPDTVLTRGTHLKIQDMDNLHAQSDYNGKHRLFGLRHEVLAGIDYSREKKVVYAARNAAQGGVTITKPTTTVGTPDDGARVDESSRVLRVNNKYVARGVGAYLQDMIELTPTWKLVAGLRFDKLEGDYDQYAIPNNAPGPVTTTPYTMKVSEWSKRVGVLYQPSDRHSFHASYGTSFNTSGDAYSLGASNADTPPEQSINMEIGAKLDSADKRFTTRMAIFHSTKLNERNTDPDLPVVTLSGRRHVSGFEIDAAGRLTHDWEIYGSYMWMPNAKVDKAAPCPSSGQCLQGAPGEREGDRPALTPEHSGTIWTTYKLTPQLRLGAGINFRGKQKPTRSEFHVPAYVTGDLMAEYHVNDDFTLKANLTNVTNKLYADQLYPAHYVPGAGRLLQLTGSYRF